jgi:hypothetical protein
VVGPREPDHVEGEDLPPDVVGSPKVDVQFDLPERVGSVPRHYSMEWRCVVA